MRLSAKIWRDRVLEIKKKCKIRLQTSCVTLQFLNKRCVERDGGRGGVVGGQRGEH